LRAMDLQYSICHDSGISVLFLAARFSFLAAKSRGLSCTSSCHAAPA
jgi:hypothetical protein